MSVSPSVLDDRRSDVPPQAVAALTNPDARFASGLEDVLGTTMPVFTHPGQRTETPIDEPIMARSACNVSDSVTTPCLLTL